MADKTNPVLPYTEITIAGTTYKLACTHRGLRKAEEELERRGIRANLLLAKLQPSLRSTGILFAAALLPYQPETDFDAAQDLVDDDNLLTVIEALDATHAKSFPDPDPEAQIADPPTLG
jgi:hypothetical protein